jgi:hypothetical protein
VTLTFFVGREDYTKDLKGSGIQAIANGLVFSVLHLSVHDGNTVDKDLVWQGPNQLWQDLSIHLRAHCNVRYGNGGSSSVQDGFRKSPYAGGAAAVQSILHQQFKSILS